MAMTSEFAKRSSHKNIENIIDLSFGCDFIEQLSDWI